MLPKMKIVMTASLVLAVFVLPEADAQRRMSLADRVTALEEQLAARQGVAASDQQPDLMVDLLEQVQQLRRDVQMLTSQLEEAQFEIETLQSRQRDQYLDLDSRVSALSSGGAVITQSTRVTDSTASMNVDTAQNPVGAVTAPVEAPEIRAPIDAQISTSGIDETPALSQVQPLADPAAERKAYEEAFTDLKDGRYAAASRAFDAFIKSYPGSEYADNATYWLGESYYVTGNYRIALDAFQKLLNDYPDSSKVGDALLKIGYAQYELEEWESARQALNSVKERYPDTTVARLADARLRAMRLEGHIQ